MNTNKNFGIRNKENQKDIDDLKFDPDWIIKGFNNNTLKFCEKFGKYLVIGMTTSQIRNDLGEVKRIQLSGI